MLPPIPPSFLERMARLLGDEYPAFADALEKPPTHGLRVNTLKLTADRFQTISPYRLGERVPWCDSAFSVDGEDEFGKHPYHLAGLYYLQDPSAMSAAALLDPQPGERVLDLAAAPGGKTTHLAALMNGSGLLVANEIKDKRVGHLAVNVERWGAGNVVITNESPERLADHFGAWFDRVLVDAPCSGEGMFRKDPGARADWSPEMVEGCAVRQGKILRVAAKLVRPGGMLVYSTCTFAPEEDEGVVNGLLNGQTERNGLQTFEVVALHQSPGFVPGKPEWLSPPADKTLTRAARLFPHRLTGEGHFVCALRKSDGQESDRLLRPRDLRPSRAQLDLWEIFVKETLAVNFLRDRFQVYGERLYLVPENIPSLNGLRVVHPGVWLGNFKKDRFEPAHPLALHLQAGQAINSLNLSATDYQEPRSPLRVYLRGESLPGEGAPGWVLVCMDGFSLGWGKRVQGVVKNHFPRGWMA